MNYFNIFFGIVSLTFVELFEIVFGDFIVKVFFFVFMDLMGKILII